MINKVAYAYFISGGTYVPYFNKAQVSNSGETQKFELNPTVGIGTNIIMNGPHVFLPEFTFSYFLENAKNTKRDLIQLHYSFGYILNQNFLLRYGLTNNWYRLHGLGGSASLGNGSATQSFPSPDKTDTSYFTTLDFGLEYMLPNKRFSLRYDLQMMSFQELDNRAFNYLLTVNFYQ